ncbi:MAG: hypothetical protein JW982_14055 [Spirochaetes bacterium]|nr:hypothetical protein [Spirochaetota bacterium]
MSRTVKIFFPIGIFLILFMLFFSLSSGISGYFYYKYMINFIDKSTGDANNASIALIDACSIIAEISDGDEQIKRLSDFFAGSPQKNLFSSAFYASGNGKIIAHSNPAEVRELNGNLASDEFKYNIDQIFFPLSQEGKKIYLSDYFILDEEIPFSKEEIRYLKQYLYKNIDRNGWLASKAIEKKIKTGKNKYEIRKTGTINFILSKKNIYSEILKTKEKLIRNTILLGAVSCLLSLFISLIIYMRFISIKRKTLRSAPPIQQSVYSGNPEDMEIDFDDDQLPDSDDIDIITDDMYPELFDESTGEKIDFNPGNFIRSSGYSEMSAAGKLPQDSFHKPKPPIQIVFDESNLKEENDIVILDAVPIRKRRIS